MILHFNKNGEFVTATARKLAGDDIYDFVEIADEDFEDGFNYNVDGTKGTAFSVFEPTDNELAEMALDGLRIERNRLLGETDWTQSGDVPEATRLLWQSYRQALRDITENYTSIEDVVWPTKPD